MSFESNMGGAAKSMDDLKGSLKEHMKAGQYGPTILVGVGGTGAKSIQHLRKLLIERFGTCDLPGLAYLSLDTDQRSDKVAANEAGAKHANENEIAFGKEERITLHADTDKYLTNLKQYPWVDDWLDPTAVAMGSDAISKGAGQIRPVSRLTFFDSMEDIGSAIRRARNRIMSQDVNDPRFKGDLTPRVVVIAGWAGGTGSGAFMDIGALIKATWQGKISLEGIFVMPGVYRKVDDAHAKLAANGYAALRETNHYLTNAYETQWDASTKCSLESVFKRHTLISGENALGKEIATDKDAYYSIGEMLYVDFAGGPMKGWIEGVRVNRMQYLGKDILYQYQYTDEYGKQQPCSTESWRTGFCTFGISKLVYPGRRFLNYAKYDLVSLMLSQLNPENMTQMEQMVGVKRDELLLEIGLFQGKRRDDVENTEKDVHQVFDGLMKLVGEAGSAQTVQQAASNICDNFNATSEDMFLQGDVKERARVELEVAANLMIGDPRSAERAGEWSKAIGRNGNVFASEVAAKLPAAMENLRSNPEVGIAGLLDVLRDACGKLAQDANMAPGYIDWCRTNVPTYKTRAEEAEQEYRTNLENAHRVSTGMGFLKSEDNFNKAVTKASQSFENHVNLRNKAYMLEVAQSTIEACHKELTNQVGRLERLLGEMHDLVGVVQMKRDYFAEPAKGTFVTELPAPSPKEGGFDLFEGYLSANETERAREVRELMGRAFREIMDEDSLAQIEMEMKEPDRFRDRLAQWCHKALTGNESGVTVSFGGERDGFLSRFSIAKQFNALSEPKRKELLRDLYQLGLPWLKRSQGNAFDAACKPVADAFLGIGEGWETKDVNFILKAMGKHEHQGFVAQQVTTNDPTELVFFTEWTAFPAFFVSELMGAAGGKKYYEEALYADQPVPLHLHQDYHEYQPLIPLVGQQVEDLKNAWKDFHKGQMLGLFVSDNKRRGDETRCQFMYRTQTALDDDFQPVGVQSAVLRELVENKSFRNRVATAVQKREQYYVDDCGASWEELWMLAEYYLHCLYPRTNVEDVGGGKAEGSVLSLPGVAIAEVAFEYKQKAKKVFSGSDDSFATHLKAKRQDYIMGGEMRFSDWTIPMYKKKGRAVPWTTDADNRATDWPVLDEVISTISSWPNQEYRQQIGRDGRNTSTFPRLALRQDYYDSATDVKPVDDGIQKLGRYQNRTTNDQRRQVLVSDVVAMIQANPGDEHYGFEKGGSWQRCQDIPMIAALLNASATTQAPPAGGASAPPPINPPVKYHYAVGNEQKGEVADGDIAKAWSAAGRPADHKVWKDGMGGWASVGDVPALASLAPATPPPLPSGGPPPLNGSGGPPPLSDD